MALCRQVFTHYRSALQGVVTIRCVHSVSTVLFSTKLSTQDETQMATNHAKRQGDVSKILEQMSQIASSTDVKRDKIARLQSDSSFKSLSEQLEPVVGLMNVKQLLESLALLMPVSPMEDDHILKLLENQALLQMHQKLSISQLVTLTQLHSGAATKLRQEVYSAALNLVKLRWVEVNTGRDIVALLHSAHGESTFLAKIEKRALELCESFSTKELYRTMYCFARMNRRNEPLLRALVYHLAHRELHLSPIHLANLAFALAKLNLVDTALMEKIVCAILSSAEVNTSCEKVISSFSSIVQSFGILRYCNTKFLDATASFFQNNSSHVTPIDWHHLIYSAAWLGYLPESLRTDEIVRVAQSCMNVENPLMSLDIVWSCCVLSIVKPDLVSKILDETFVSNITKKCASNLIPVYMKLLNVNSLVQTVLPEYAGPLLTTDFISNSVSQLMTANKHDTLFDSVFESLSQMAPAEQYLRRDVPTIAGCVIDIEMCINDRAEPQPLSAVSSESTCQRVAILLNNFSDMTCGTVHPNGFRSFAARLLASQGYLVIQVPHSEFDVTSTIVKRVQYLHRKLKEASSLATPQETKTLSSPIKEHTASCSSVPQTESNIISENRANVGDQLSNVGGKPFPGERMKSRNQALDSELSVNGRKYVKDRKHKKDNEPKNSLKNRPGIKLNVAELFVEEG